MKVLKFEGSLFNSHEGYIKVARIIHDSLADHSISHIIVSANPETEKQLIELARKAENKHASFSDELAILEKEYLDLARKLIPVQEQSSTLSFIKQRFNEIDDLCKGISLIGECPANTLDSIQCYAAILDSFLVAAYSKAQNNAITWQDARDIFVAETKDSRVQINISLSSANLKNLSPQQKETIYIIPGGIARSKKGSNLHLKKGGSDQSASVIAVLKDASLLEIWTSNDGLTTADTSLVKNARVIKELNYEEAMELSHFEASIMYPPALEEVFKKKIQIAIKNINKPEEKGSIINDKGNADRDVIKGISNLKGIALINIEGSGMIGIPGFSKRMFSTLNNTGININFITQGASEHSICVGVLDKDANLAQQSLAAEFQLEIAQGSIEPILVENDYTIVALVGDSMKSHPGISGRMFSAMGRNGINIRAIAQGSNERNISSVIKTSDLEKTLNVLHESFFESAKKELNLFIIGTGNVGRKLIAQIIHQAESIEQSQKLKINIKGLCNSRKMLISSDSLAIEKWEQKLNGAEKADPVKFVEKMTSLNLRNSVLVDMTANEMIPQLYTHALKRSMSVVACNKIAASDSYEVYRSLKEMAVSYNCKFLFETNVGAALPIIGTLNDLTRSGDSIKSIHAVLSGTLNFVFNHYDGKNTFASVVKQAQAEGYTEPDPRLDLSGKDVMRKIMILVRESGMPLEMDEILCNSFLPASCMQGTVEDFYIELAKHENHFSSLLQEAQKNNAKLKFVASFNNGKAEVGLQHISPESEMYHLYGKDNIVLFQTERYAEQPLVIKGAGAGAEVTASGVFADILRSINN